MPQLKRKEEALRQIIMATYLLREGEKEKLEKFKGTEVGKREIAMKLHTSEGKGLKPVFVQSLDFMLRDVFIDPDGYIFRIKNKEKPVIDIYPAEERGGESG
ncbi:MAG: hypothetical protein QW555_07955 [Nitrososphaerota archaeon]